MKFVQGVPKLFQTQHTVSINLFDGLIRTLLGCPRPKSLVSLDKRNKYLL